MREDLFCGLCTTEQRLPRNNLIPPHYYNHEFNTPTCCQPQILDRNSPPESAYRPRTHVYSRRFIGEIRADLGGCFNFDSLCLPYRCVGTKLKEIACRVLSLLIIHISGKCLRQKNSNRFSYKIAWLLFKNANE